MHADRVKVPVLLVQGEDDYTALATHGRAMAKALPQHGVRNVWCSSRAATTACGARICALLAANDRSALTPCCLTTGVQSACIAQLLTAHHGFSGPGAANALKIQ